MFKRMKSNVISLLGIMLSCGLSQSQEPLDPYVEQELRGIIRDEISNKRKNGDYEYKGTSTPNPFENFSSRVAEQQERIRQQESQLAEQEKIRLEREKLQLQVETTWRQEITLAKMLSAQNKHDEAVQTATEALTYCRNNFGEYSKHEMTNYEVLANIYDAKNDVLNSGLMQMGAIKVAINQENPDYFDIGDLCAKLSGYASKHDYKNVSEKYDAEATKYWKLAYEKYNEQYTAMVTAKDNYDYDTIITLCHNLSVTASRLKSEKYISYWSDKKKAWENHRK